jgi:diadenylate cyclase
MTGFLSGIRWQDIVDIVVVAMLIYWLLVFIKGTRAVQMLTGLAILLLGFVVSDKLEFLTLRWMLSNFLSSIILVIIILFQSDIRRVLTQVGKGTFFRGSQEKFQLIEEVSRAAISLASKSIGALIVLERTTGLNDYAETGTALDARVSRELLLSIFHPLSPLHDGAVIIQKDRISAAGCFLPLTANPRLDKSYGTRHRAAIGLSEETDAVVVLVSEERARVSLVVNGVIGPSLDKAALDVNLRELLASPASTEPGRNT